MKQSFILWLGAFVIIFLSGYIQTLTSPDYPISGSFSIGLKKVSYFFEKIHRDNDDYQIIIRTDVDSLKGKIFWKKKSSNMDWRTINMKPGEKTLLGKIPHQPPKTKIEYKVKLNYSNSTFNLPESGNFEIEFLGKVPKSIMIFSFLSLFGGLLFSVRTALDYFNENEKIKKLTVFTVMIWISNVMIFAPVKRTYELSSKIGLSALPISDIFQLNSIIILAFWIISLIIIFNVKNYKIYTLAAGIITLVLFQFIK